MAKTRLHTHTAVPRWRQLGFLVMTGAV